MRVWKLWYNQDGWRVQLLEARPWWVALEKLGVPAINTLTLHMFCCSIPQIAFSIPLGAAQYVDDYLANSLGGKMCDLGQWINALGTFKHTTNEAWMPITPDMAFQLDSDFFAEIQDVFHDTRED